MIMNRKALSGFVFLSMLTGCVPTDVIQPSSNPEANPSLPITAKPRLIEIPSGVFTMGDQSMSGDADERPAHSVEINSFLLSKYEITVQQYKYYQTSTGQTTPDLSAYNDKQPVMNISWSEANSYAKWLSSQTNKKWRLPTEAEWEYAARAGAVTLYANGNKASDLCQIANIADQSTINAGLNWQSTVLCNDGYSNQTSEVGNFRPNAFGLYDMHGNVWEWVENCYSTSYPNVGHRESCEKRVIRGGSFMTASHSTRLSNRESLDAGVSTLQVGFRLAREL